MANKTTLLLALPLKDGQAKRFYACKYIDQIIPQILGADEFKLDSFPLKEDSLQLFETISARARGVLDFDDHPFFHTQNWHILLSAAKLALTDVNQHKLNWSLLIKSELMNNDNEITRFFEFITRSVNLCDHDELGVCYTDGNACEYNIIVCDGKICLKAYNSDTDEITDHKGKYAIT